MGGKLFADREGFVTNLTRQQYSEVVSEINDMLYSFITTKRRGNSNYKNIDYSTLTSVSSKASFGDIDYVISNRFTPEMFKEMCEYAHRLKPWKKEPGYGTSLYHSQTINDTCVIEDYIINDDVMSFLHPIKKVQVDIIRVNTNHSVTDAAAYYSYGGLGGLIAPMLRNAGLIMGPSGVKYPVYIENQKMDELQLTSVIDSHNCLGLDYYYRRPGPYYGFANKIELFRYVVGSKFFSLETYDINEQGIFIGNNNKFESPLYGEFITWVVEQNKTTPFRKALSEQEKKWREDSFKFNFRHSIASNKDRIVNLVNAHYKAKEVAKRFNGELVMKVLNIQPGEEVGKELKKFKQSFNSTNEYELFVLASSAETIEKKIKEVHLSPSKVKNEKVKKNPSDKTKEPPLTKTPKSKTSSTQAKGITPLAM